MNPDDFLRGLARGLNSWLELEFWKEPATGDYTARTVLSVCRRSDTNERFYPLAGEYGVAVGRVRRGVTLKYQFPVTERYARDLQPYALKQHFEANENNILTQILERALKAYCYHEVEGCSRAVDRMGQEVAELKSKAEALEAQVEKLEKRLLEFHEQRELDWRPNAILPEDFYTLGT